MPGELILTPSGPPQWKARRWTREEFSGLRRWEGATGFRRTSGQQEQPQPRKTQPQVPEAALATAQPQRWCVPGLPGPGSGEKGLTVTGSCSDSSKTITSNGETPFSGKNNFIQSHSSPGCGREQTAATARHHLHLNPEAAAIA